MLSSFFTVVLSLASLTLASPSKRANTIGYIRISDGGEVIGYLSHHANSDGEFIGVNPATDSADVKSRMIVQLDESVDGLQSVLITNSAVADSYPYLGAFSPSSGSIGVNSSDYVLICGSSETAAGAAPSAVGNTYTDSTGNIKMSESAVWTYDSSNQDLSFAWVNPDGTNTTGFIGYVDSSFIFTGDKKAFTAEYKPAPEWVTFQFETS